MEGVSTRKATKLSQDTVGDYVVQFALLWREPAGCVAGADIPAKAVSPPGEKAVGVWRRISCTCLRQRVQHACAGKSSRCLWSAVTSQANTTA